jgi:hypothetical protein
MNMPLPLLNRRRRAGVFNPVNVLFGANEVGFAAEVSPSVLWQDTARTTPVTTPGNTAASWALPGAGGSVIYATQSTAAARPIYGRHPFGGRRNILVQTATLATQTRAVTAAQHTLSFRGTGTVTLSGTSTAGPLVGTGANDIVSLTFTPTAGNLTLTVSGTVNDAQLELGAARSGYQLVSDAGGYNVTEAGVPDVHYLFHGGASDPRWMITPTITPGTDKVQTFAGVRKLSDAAQAVVAELSTATGLNSGSLALFAPSTANADRVQFNSRGTLGSAAFAAGLPAPVTVVASGLSDIAGDLVTLRVNGTQAAQSTADQGTGNFLAYPLYIGMRGGTSLPLNGQIYGLIVRFGPNLDPSVIAQTERWMADKTGITL